MRLIDKDAILHDLENGVYPASMTYTLAVDIAKGLIEVASEIDAVPVVRGEWIVTDAYPHRVYCSLCYKTNVPNEESLFERNEYPKFCMWCGARMEDKQ
jgi:hypothetical protein